MITAPRVAATGDGAWRFRAFGVDVALTSEDDTLLAMVRQQLPSFEGEPAGRARGARRYEVRATRAGFRLVIDGRRPGRARTREGAAWRLVEDLQLHLARKAPGFAFVHAGVVVVDGGAVVMPGASGAGKSRLVAALVEAGARYASDELAVLDRRGRVWPFARPLTLRAPEGLRRIAAGALPGGAARGPSPLRLVLQATYRQDARWAPSPVAPGRAALHLLRHALAARARPAEVLAAVRAAVAASPAVQGVRGEACEVAAEVMRRLAS